MTRSLSSILLVPALAACGPAPASVPAGASAGAAEFTGPAGSGMPNLSRAADGRVILTWIEPVAGGHALRLAVRSPEGGWSAPRTIRESDRYFVNWADFPSLVTAGEEEGGSTWVVHWLEKTAASPYAYHVLLARSTDEGATWSAPFAAHRDRSNTEHGFVSLSPRPGGGADLVWLDGRRMADPPPTPGAMGVRATSLDAAGRLGEEVELDARTCECCQTALVRTRRGLLAAYRDRSPDEIRDIAVVRERDGRWSEPEIVTPDGWEHRACPVNGPALAAEGDRVALAWYTGASGRPRVSLMLSEDGGERFGPRLQMDDGDPVGRVDAVILAGGAVAVVWLEGVDQETAEWRVRRVEAGGPPGPSRAIATVSRARRSGFPRVAAAGEDLLVAFTATEPPGGVRVLRMPMGAP